MVHLDDKPNDYIYLVCHRKRDFINGRSTIKPIAAFNDEESALDYRDIIEKKYSPSYDILIRRVIKPENKNIILPNYSIKESEENE